METKKSKTIVKEHRYLLSDEDECDRSEKENEQDESQLFWPWLGFDGLLYIKVRSPEV